MQFEGVYVNKVQRKTQMFTHITVFIYYVTHAYIKSFILTCASEDPDE